MNPGSRRARAHTRGRRRARYGQPETTPLRLTCVETGGSSPYPFALLEGSKNTLNYEQGRVRYSLHPAQATT